METLNLFKGYGKVTSIEEGQHQQTQNPPKPTQTPNHNLVKAILLITLTLLLILVVCIGSLTHLSTSSSSSSSSSESLRTVCAVTQHPDSCFSTISSLDPDVKPDPVRIYNDSLLVALRELKNVSPLPESLIPRAEDKRSESALRDCASLLGDAVSQLERSMDEMKVGPVEKMSEMKISDMQTWISAAMTDEDTCLDGLEEMESGFIEEVKVRLQRSREYMSNTLAILNHLKSLLI